jgi:DNA-directed RNA polymerase subunit RPC12/RpoP
MKTTFRCPECKSENMEQTNGGRMRYWRCVKCGHRWATSGSLESLGYVPTPARKITAGLRAEIEATTLPAEEIALKHGLRLAQVNRLIGRAPLQSCCDCIHWDEHYDLRCDLDHSEALQQARYGCGAFSPNTSRAH